MSVETTNVTDDRVLTAYSVIADRRLGYDQMAWQTPALGFTAQAFLLTIALGPDSSRTARLLSATLALVVALLSIQLLRKHHFMELIDSVILERIERDHGIAAALAVGRESWPAHVHAQARDRVLGLTLRGGGGVRAGWMAGRDSPLLWTWGLALFALVALVVIVLTLFRPSVLA
jgi:hypothetical protein